MQIPSGAFAPAGSNRSSRGGNETAEAFGVEGPERDLAIMQAVTRVNAEQASKSLMRKSTQLSYGEDCHLWGSERDVHPGFRRGSGDGMHERGRPRNTGNPIRRSSVKINQRPARERLGAMG